MKTGIDRVSFKSQLCNIFCEDIYHIYDIAEVTGSDFTYLQYENIHIIFVNGINVLNDFMARPKSSQCMYTSTNMPINVL